MRKLVLGLTASTLIFGASTLYLWRELSIERAKSVPVVAGLETSVSDAADRANLVTPTSRARDLRSTVSGTSAAKSASATGAPARGTDTVPDMDAVKRQQAAWARAFLDQLDDPTRRAKLIAEIRKDQLRDYPWAAQRLALSADEYDKFLDLLSRQDLVNREKFARCGVDPDCTYRGMSREERKQQAQQVTDLLGAERARQFDDYRDSLTERKLVTELRASLPDQAYLSSDLSESLISALLDERRQVVSEAQAAGVTLGEFGMGNNMYYYDGAGPPAEQIASAEAYARRLTARAAQILNAQQLDAFKKMQAEALDRLREELPRLGNSANGS